MSAYDDKQWNTIAFRKNESSFVIRIKFSSIYLVKNESLEQIITKKKKKEKKRDGRKEKKRKKERQVKAPVFTSYTVHRIKC